MKIAPRINIWAQIGPVLGDVNCGRKARKKRATLGFRTFIKNPRQNVPARSDGVARPVVARPNVVAGSPARGTSVFPGLLRIAFHARNKRYATPPILRMLNAIGDARNTT